MSSETRSHRKLGYREYVCFPADGRRHEVIRGEHVVNPAPNTYHQTVSRRIQFQLHTQIELEGLGQVFDAPTDLQLSETDIVQPDLIVVREHNRKLVTPTKIKGPPDLVVEILSDASAATDRVLKKELYRRAGVLEYWLVDPDDHVVEQFVLRGEYYALIGRHAEAVEVQVQKGVSVNLTDVWQVAAGPCTSIYQEWTDEHFGSPAVSRPVGWSRVGSGGRSHDSGGSARGRRRAGP